MYDLNNLKSIEAVKLNSIKYGPTVVRHVIATMLFATEHQKDLIKRAKLFETINYLIDHLHYLRVHELSGRFSNNKTLYNTILNILNDTDTISIELFLLGIRKSFQERMLKQNIRKT